MITLPWSAIKQLVAMKGALQYVEDSDNIYVFLVDGTLQLTCRINKSLDIEAKEDFEANYKDNANISLWQNDSDGAQIVRPKAAKKGWSFWAVPIELTTSTIGGSVYFKDASGNDIPGVTCKIYNGNNQEITDAGLANVNLGTCVKTVLDFEPAFDYEMIGGALRINSNPAQDVRLWIVGAPDIPANFGGSKEFASGINLKFLAPDSSFEIDGRVSKYITYSNITHSGKLRVILKHPAGLALNIQVIIHMYRL